MSHFFDGILMRNVQKIYRTKKGFAHALANTDLRIASQSKVAIVGPSGSGKSTLIHLIAGLVHPTRGQIFVMKYPVHRMNEDQLSSFRQKNIGLIFQDYHLIETMNALENVSIPLMLAGLSKKQRLYQSEALLDNLGLSDFSHHFPAELSGGQQQRVAIARALISHPKIILADEPTGNLDDASTQIVVELLKQYVTTWKSTLLIVTHDLNIAQQVDYAIHLHNGFIIQDGTTEDNL